MLFDSRKGIISPRFESCFQLAVSQFGDFLRVRLYEIAPLQLEDDRGFWELKYWYAFEPDYLQQLPQLAQIAGVPDSSGVHGDRQQLLQQPTAGPLRRVSVRPARLVPVPQRRHKHCAIQRQVLRSRFQLLLWSIQLLRLQLLSYSSRDR